MEKNGNLKKNGEEWKFEENQDGTYTMPSFENMTEDKHVVVTYSLKDNKIIINKVDSEDNSKKLEGATFKLDQLEERTDPDNEKIIGDIVANGKEYAEADVDKGEVAGVIGELANNGTYYFVENSDGALVPTNSKTYQVANGGSSGIQSVTANSYIPIDLSGKSGQYVVVVNANVSSESADYGYATVNQSTTAPSYSSSTGRFMYISGTSSSVTTAKDYTSNVLEGGQTYYLHLGYRKSSSIDTGDDQVVINSVKVYEASSTSYNFIDNGSGGYESNNQGKDNTVANSYIPIDLTNYSGKYNLTVNANVSSQSSDYGYATVNQSTTAPSYSSTGRFIYISGTVADTDYTTVLQGGQMYYLHLGYYKNGSTSTGDDKFTVNSIKVTLNDSELYHSEEITTNSLGQAITQVPFGKYQITEIVAPEGYELNSEPIVVEFREDGIHEFTIENNKKAQILVHHYLKNEDGSYTTIKVAEDELLEGKNGEKYTTSPNLDLEKYELEKNEEGEYVIPENATGVYTPGVTEVIYYYEEKEIPLTVHHYIEGTEEKVPLKDGGVAEDVTDIGKEGESYTTSAIDDSYLSDDYELVEVPENAEGTYSGDEVIVTYFYKKVERPVTIIKTGEDGEKLDGVKFKIENINDIGNVEIGDLTRNEEYYFVEQDGKYIANNTGHNDSVANSYIKIDLTSSPNQLLTINAQISCEENYDNGYAYITESEDIPSGDTGRIFEISGEVPAKDYEVELEGGKVYYLHFIYEKDSIDEDDLKGDDTFIINSVKVEAKGEKYVTNSEGKITAILEVGDYRITEIETKEGYAIPENPSQDIQIRKDQESYELNIENPKAQGTVITHYYKEGTEEKVPLKDGSVAEDVIKTGIVGDIYITEAARNVDDRYELKQVVGEVNGLIEEGQKEIIYYYGLKNSNLTITKTDEEGKGLEGAEFKIENKENGKVNYATTEEGGKITVKVPIGESIITETKAPEGYKLNKESQNINIELNKENNITFENEKINYYTLELNKIDAETKETLSNINFELKYTDQYGKEFVKNYTTDENGKITLENLEDEIVYTIKEIGTPKGYLVDTEEKQFVVHYVDGEYSLEILNGTIENIVIENNTIKANVVNNPSLKIVKQDENGKPIEGVKFKITDEAGQEVTDGFGNQVGEVEEINGEQQSVLTTNENGVIAENLLPGKYVITELQTPSKYILPEESERAQTIEITAQGFAKTYVEQTGVTDLDNLFTNISNIIDMDSLESNIGNTEITTDGKMVLTSGLLKDTTISGENTVLGEDINLEVTGGMENAINIKLTPEGKVENVVLIKTDNDSASVGTNALSMINGEYVTLGMYMGTIRIPAEDTANNQELTLTASGDIGQFMTKYNSEGKIISLKDVTYLGLDLNNYYDIQMKDLGNKITIAYLYNDYQLTIPNTETATGEEMTINNQSGIMIVNLDSELKVIDGYSPIYTEYKYETESGEILSTGGTIVGGYNSTGEIIFSEDETESGEKIELDNYDDGVITKYNASGKVEWAKELGVQNGYGGYALLKEISDGYLAKVYYQGNLVISAEETAYGEEIKFENLTEEDKTVLIKYTTDGKVEWAVDVDSRVAFSESNIIKETPKGYIVLGEANLGGDFNDIPILIIYEKIYEEPIVGEQTVVTIQNELNNGNVIVHHYKENTEESLSADQTITGKIDSSYETHPATDILANYELVEMPENSSGTIVEGTTEVIYYYRLKEPTIETPTITKESSIEKVTEEGQNIDYTINYKTTIKDYIGDAEIKIVDELPYEIDESKVYNLEGGIYNKENKTITWTEEITGIDTYTNGEKEIEITKEINFSYVNEDYSQKNIVNKVKGTINLKTPEKEETVEDEKEIEAEYKINITANKVWNDNSEQSSRRPESVTLVVKNGDEEVASKVVNSSNLVAGTTNKWSVEFEGLPKYDANGEKIEYTVEERETNEGDLHFYEAEEGSVIVEDNQATIRNNFVKPNDTTEVHVTKVWNDNENINGRRPSSIKLQIKNGENVVAEQVVTEADNWSHTFTNLPKYDDNGKEIVYTASEVEVNSGDLKFYENTGVSGDMTSGYTITNTFIVPDEKISLTVNKVWVDNDIQNDRRPEVVTINVFGEDGSVVATYDLDVVGGETSHTFTDLPKYNSENGKEINYTVEEGEKNPGDLHFYTGVVGNVENTSENSKEVTITNTFKKLDDTTDVLVTKVWEDNNDEAGKRPTSIKLLLKNGSETVKGQEVSGDTDTWTYTFKDVAMYNENGQEIVYSVDEAEVNSGDLQFYNKSVSGLTLTNEFTQDTSTVDVPVSKIWVDNGEQSSRRPASVRIILKANEIKVREYDLTGTGDTWNYTFEDLPKYDSYNNIINYTVEEEEVNSGDLKFYSSSVDGTTITNTFTRPSDVVSIEVTKNWEDQENVYGKRPISVRINVMNGTDLVQTAIVTKDDNWTHTFTNLAKYDENGQEILYTVSEEEVMENDLFYYTGNVGIVTNKIGETNVKEAVVTNEMTKIPSKVIVKYVDKATGEEISGQKEKEGIIGDPFDVTEDVKEIPGYTLVEEPEEKTGTYTSEVQEKVYYYAKDTRVIVKYLEKDETPEDDSDNKVLSDEIILGGYEGKSYTTNSKVIEGYTLVETKGNLNGTMTREEQVVVYYYAKDTKVIVKYLEKDDTPEVLSDNKVLLPEKTIEGYVGKEYTTEGETIPNYTLVEKTTNYEGTMTEETIIVVYYYAKNTNVTVRYLEKDSTESDSDNKELVPDIVIEGYAGKDYETEKKQISGYTFVEVKGEVSGKMTEEPIEVIYYYAQNTKAKVEHIDRETGEILKEETTNGKVGDLFTF